MRACAQVGLEKINFSVFGTTPGELAAVQHARYRDPVRAARKLDALRASIEAALDFGVQANVNIVVPDRTHIERVHRLLDAYAPQVSVRLLADGQESVDAVEQALAEREAVPEARYVTAGASGVRTAYRMPDGRQVYFKEIRRVRLPYTCSGCRFDNGTERGRLLRPTVVPRPGRRFSGRGLHSAHGPGPPARRIPGLRPPRRDKPAPRD